MNLLSLQGSWSRINQAGLPLVLEALFELLRARVLTWRSPARYLPDISKPAASFPRSSAELHAARQVCRILEAVARRMPFRAVCLQQSLAAKRMLDRRGHAATLFLAVSKTREDRALPKQGAAAHAGVCVGDMVVCGDYDLHRFAVVARFH